MSDRAKIILEGKEHDLPVVTGSEKENAVDISKLRASTGYITIDPGYKNTGATTSAITFLDGEKGILRYRGYPIEQLAEKASFTEVAYLLIYGELPNSIEFQLFERSIKRHTLVHEDMKRFLKHILRRRTRWVSYHQWYHHWLPSILNHKIQIEIRKR